MITVVVGKEIEKIKGEFESYLNGLNMVGEISYSQYSKLYDEGIKQIQRAYELGKSELEAEVEQLQKINSEQKEMLKKVRIALIQERTANLMNYGMGGVEIFDSILRRVKENDKT